MTEETKQADQGGRAHEFTDLKVTGNLEEMTAWLSNIRAPGMFDTRFPFVIVPQSLKLLDMEASMPFPRMIRKAVKFIDTASFLDYFNLFRAAYKPRLFTAKDSSGMSILCVFDYDGPGIAIGTATETGPSVSMPQPMWGAHRATLSLSYDPDFKSLKDNENRWFDQEEFALFVEENTHLFVNPTGADMLELAQELKGVRNANWQAGKRLANGQVGLQYIETVEAKSVRGEIEVPEYLEISTPIYNGYEAQTIRAAFRWKMDKNDGSIQFSFRLLTKVAERQAEESVKASVVQETVLPLYNVSSFDGIIGKAV